METWEGRQPWWNAHTRVHASVWNVSEAGGIGRVGFSYRTDEEALVIHRAAIGDVPVVFFNEGSARVCSGVRILAFPGIEGNP